MHRIGWVTVGLATACLWAGSAGAQNLIIYPANGQDQATQDRDRGECHVWAIQQSGFDPANVAAAPPQEATRGGTLRGAGRGAAGGAIIGAIAGNAGKGAAIGAAAGGVTGTARRRDQQRQQDQTQANMQAQQDAGRAGYNRALSACLTGRGYTVN